MELIHHGGHRGVTGSCHQLKLPVGKSLLVDCGLFQGEDRRRHPKLAIEFPLDSIECLLLTHVHIDHVGRLPYLFGAGFRSPIYCSRPTAKLLPLVIEDAIKIGFTRDRRINREFQELVNDHLRPLEYGTWRDVECGARVRFHPAGHILGSAWIEVQAAGQMAVFFGDLGAPHAPLLKDPQSPEQADMLVPESTYGDRRHDGRATRQQRLEQILRRTLRDNGVTIIPAFSLGRTQELLYEMNGIFERIGQQEGEMLMKRVDVIVDSPLASRFTQLYEELQPFWDDEAHELLSTDDQPLVFDNLTTIGDHEEHTDTIEYLRTRGLPAIVVAGSGMCTGGRVVNYLKAFLGEDNTDVIFVGYQASGTEGRAIQERQRTVRLDGHDVPICANVHSIPGYSAHADQKNLLDFVRGMQQPPGEIVLVHGESHPRAELARKLDVAGFHVRGNTG